MIKPTLGYPTRTAAVEALLGQGLSAQQIADELGGTKNSVLMLTYSLRRRVADRRIILPRKMANALSGAAAARGVDASELIIELLDLILRDDLFEALLGDPEGAL